jgi:YHS domain-containing protein
VLTSRKRIVSDVDLGFLLRCPKEEGYSEIGSRRTIRFVTTFACFLPKNIFILIKMLYSGAVMVIDPICKMRVDERKAKFKSEHQGKTYYFCSAQCKKEFDENPKKYA